MADEVTTINKYNEHNSIFISIYNNYNEHNIISTS